MTIIVIGGLTTIYIEVLLNDTYKLFYDSLAERNSQHVYANLIALIFLCFLISTNSSSHIILSDWLDLKLRKNISDGLFAKAYCKIGHVDMLYSDQRIAEDVEIFTSKFAIIGITFIFMFIKSAVFFVILWKLSPAVNFNGITINGSVAIVALLYFLIPSSASYLFGIKMMKYEDKRRRAEAHMRYSVIAALQDKNIPANNRFVKNLSLIVKTTTVSMKLNFVANFINLGLGGISFVIPIMFVLPSYLNGDIQLGDVIKATGAFSIFQVGINYLHYNFREVIRCIAAFGRINAFAKLIH